MTAILAELGLGGLGLGGYVFAASLVVVTLGAVTQTVTGQAFGMVVAPLLALAAPERLPATTLLLGGVVTVMAALSVRGRIAWNELAPATAGRAAGAALASALIGFLASGDGIPTAIAVCTLAAVALSLMGLRFRITWRSLLAAGALSGLMATFTSIGAPPMGLLYQRERAAKTRATLNLYFLIGIVFSLAAVAPHGLLRWADVTFAALLTPALALGVVLGRMVIARIGDMSLRPVILTLATAAAVAILLK